MIERLLNLTSKNERFVLGLMSGTSADGIDAALVKISGNHTNMELKEIAFHNYSYPDGIKERIFRLFDDASAMEICHMNFLLGGLFADAAIDIAKRAGIDKIDLIGSHGQTIYHIPDPIDKDYPIRSTLQIGEGSVIAHKTGAVTVCDFRVADVAAGGLGAPLVPYTEFLLYSNPSENIALQNIGGIANVTVIPAGAEARDIIAFDTGPGNMVMDYLMKKLFGCDYDKNGLIATSGTVNGETLAHFMKDEYILRKPPKTTGREYFGKDFPERFYAHCAERGISSKDIIATATAFSAAAISYSINNFVPYKVSKLIIGGGGAYNNALLAQIKELLPEVHVMTQEKMGRNSDSKEAVAFAILANETIFGNPGNLPGVTGASCGKVLGKIIVD